MKKNWKTTREKFTTLERFVALLWLLLTKHPKSEEGTSEPGTAGQTPSLG